MTDDKAKAREVWNRARANLATMETQILALMRHPDTTTEELFKAHEAYMDVHTSMVETSAALEKKFPRSNTFTLSPWRIK